MSLVAIMESNYNLIYQLTLKRSYMVPYVYIMKPKKDVLNRCSVDDTQMYPCSAAV